MGVTTVFAEPCLAWSITARLLLTLAGLEWATTSFAVWLFAFALALAIAISMTTAAWVIHMFIIHDSIVIEAS